MRQFKSSGWKISAIGAASVVVGQITSASAATLHVATNGSSTVNYGQAQSSATPATYARAIFLAQTNDTLLFKPGIYNRANLGTSSGFAIAIIDKSNLTLKAQNRAADPAVAQSSRSVIEVTDNEKSFYHVFYMKNRTNITIDGFEIDGSETNNSTDKGRTNGISIEASDYITCKYNVVHDNASGIVSVATRDTANPNINFRGVVLDASDFVTIDNNVVYNNCNYSTFESSGISLLHCKNFNTANGDFHNRITNNKVYNNIILDNGNGGGQTHTDGNGIIIDTLSGNNPAPGYSPSYPDTGYTDMVGNPIPRTLVENNVAYNNGGRAIHVFRSANVTVRNNSTYNNSQDSTYSPAEIVAAFSKNLLYANNISHGNPARTNLPVFSVYTNSSYAPANTVTWRNNTHYNGTVAGNISMSSAVVSNMLNRDPRYFYLPTGDLRLGNYSPQAGIDNGSAINGDFSSTDILGVARPQNAGIDRGAYERVFTADRTSASSTGS